MKKILFLFFIFPALSWSEEINLLCTVADADLQGYSFDIDIDMEKKLLFDDGGAYYIITQLDDRYLYAYRDIYKRKVTIDRYTGEGSFYNVEGGYLKEFSFECVIKSKLF